VIADAALLLLANGCFLAAGFGVTRACGRWGGVRDAPRVLGLSYVVGVAAVGVVAPLLLVLGLSLDVWQALLLCAALAATGLLPRRLPLRLPAPAERAPVALLALAGALLALLAVDLWWQPLWSYDSWTFWTPKARALVELGGLDERWFTGADVLNPDYPMLLPAVEAIGFRFTGYETRLLDLQSWLLLGGLVLALVELLRPRARALVVGAVVAMLAAAPSVGFQTAAAQADVPLAAFLALTAVLAWIWLEEQDTGALMLAAVLGSAAAATKVEGIPFAAAVLGVAALLALLRGRGRDAAVGAGLGLVGIAVATVPWRLWLASVDVGNQAAIGRADDLGSRLGRIPVATARLVWELVDPTAWLLLVPVAVVLGVLSLVSSRRDTAAWLIGGTLVLSMAALVVAYWTSPFELGFHLDRSARRVVMPAVLVAAALTPLLGAAGGRPAAGESSGRG
jgi:4-amino-4-deoxy-L-arabinose transferase-like glycosyltransferase